MRPGIAADNGEPRPRKHSLAAPPTDRHHATPTTFFLRRGSDVESPSESVQAAQVDDASPVQSLKATIEETDRVSQRTLPRLQNHSTRSSSRRRSTIKALDDERLRRDSSIQERGLGLPNLSDGRSTPSPLPSHDISLPSSPKSISSRSIQKSDDELTNDDMSSQAVASSEEEDGDMHQPIQESAPQLVMPSIKMPSRRPFTERGKRMGRFKILIAGSKGRISMMIQCFSYPV